MKIEEPTGALASSPLPKLTELNCLDYLAKVSKFCHNGDFPSLEEQLEEIDECECDVNKLKKWKRIKPYVEKMEATERLSRAGIIDENGELADPYRDDSWKKSMEDWNAEERKLCANKLDMLEDKKRIKAERKRNPDNKVSKADRDRIMQLIRARTQISRVYGSMLYVHSENKDTKMLELESAAKTIDALIETLIDEL